MNSTLVKIKSARAMLQFMETLIEAGDTDPEVKAETDEMIARIEASPVLIGGINALYSVFAHFMPALKKLHDSMQK